LSQNVLGTYVEGIALFNNKFYVDELFSMLLKVKVLDEKDLMI